MALDVASKYCFWIATVADPDRLSRGAVAATACLSVSKSPAICLSTSAHARISLIDSCRKYSAPHIEPPCPTIHRSNTVTPAAAAADAEPPTINETTANTAKITRLIVIPFVTNSVL